MRRLVSSAFFCVLFLCVQGQDKCEDDAGCSGDDCCSSFGFCGEGEGFCTPSTKEDSNNRNRNRNRNRARPGGRSGPGDGCELEDVEWVGGDLPTIVGGGGIELDRDTEDECYERCDENPECKWYTYDTQKDLCYLKGGRGYMRNRTDGFISGATFRDGCISDPLCETPYSYNRQQCLFFSEQHHPWSPSLADARRNFNISRATCGQYGGFIPNDFSGFSGSSLLGDRWHWVGYGADENQCWACRPGRWAQGVRAFPCTDNLSFACERNRAYPLPLPRFRPRVYSPGGSRSQIYVVSNGRRARYGSRRRMRDILTRRYHGSIRNNPFLFV